MVDKLGYLQRNMKNLIQSTKILIRRKTLNPTKQKIQKNVNHHHKKKFQIHRKMKIGLINFQIKTLAQIKILMTETIMMLLKS